MTVTNLSIYPNSRGRKRAPRSHFRHLKREINAKSVIGVRLEKLQQSLPYPPGGTKVTTITRLAPRRR